MEYIPRLFDVDDSERTEDELAALHQADGSKIGSCVRFLWMFLVLPAVVLF